MRNKVLIAAIAVTAVCAAGCSKNPEAGKAENAPVAVVKGVSLETVKNVAMPELLDVSTHQPWHRPRAIGPAGCVLGLRRREEVFYCRVAKTLPDRIIL